MPIPDRPVDGAEIATDWGQEVHDRTFAPKGTSLNSANTSTVTTTTSQLNLDSAVDDPGGWLDAANDQAEVPTGAEGLYLGIVKIDSVNGTAGDFTRCYIVVNGVQYASAIEENAGAVHIAVTTPLLASLSAGDQIRVHAQKKGSGTNPTVRVESFVFVLLGDGVGA